MTKIKYNVYCKRLDGSVDLYSAGVSLRSALMTIETATKLIDEKSDVFYYYCVPV